MSEKFDYEKFYERVGSEIGWDFSELRSIKEGRKWEFYDEVLKRVGEGKVGLDLATGGGKKILNVFDSFESVVGIDSSEAMIETARKNLKDSKADNVEFLKMDAMDLDFPNESFDFVTCRHGPFNSKEVYRVLKNGGVFMTQQVGVGDKRNIKEAFERGQSWGEEEGSFMRRLIKELEEAGFVDLEKDEYEAVEYYEREEDVVFLLKNTPIVIDFGEKEGDFEILDEFIKENMTEKGVKTTEKRFMLFARKNG